MDFASSIRLIALAAIWGASFIFTRVGVPVFGPAVLILLRVGLAALFLSLVAWRMRRALAIARNWRHYFIIGAFNCSVPFMLYAYSAQYLNASLLAIVNATAPISGAIVAAIWLRTPLTRTAMLGLALGFAGVAMIVGGDMLNSEPGDGSWLLPLLAALTAPICYGIASSYTKLYASDIDPYNNAHGSMWGAALLVLPVCLFLPAPRTPAPFDWSVITALAVLCTGVAYVLYFRLIRDVGPARALTVTFLIPVFGVLWGMLFLGESVSWMMLGGGLVVLLGTALSNGAIRRPQAICKQVTRRFLMLLALK
ncbi:MAG TPA: DMT family transporter [Rhodocyclaceae bacterium]|nr:DMT family transporter [Rhodocyclaceae bacterium]